MQSIVLHCPSGIGDVSWMLSKLVHVKDRELHLRVADGWPHRTVNFLKLLPWVASVEYGPSRYEDILAFERHNLEVVSRWDNIKQLMECPLAPNFHLESGRRLEDWLPDLPTEFHYEIPTSDEDKELALHHLKGLRRPILGVSAASYRGSEAWRTWNDRQWMDCLRRVKDDVGPFTVLLMGGFWDDLTATLAYHLGREGFSYADIVGKTSIGAAIEVLRMIDLYLGFSSGLGVIRTVLRKPAMLLWPEHQFPLSTSWAPPHMIESREYVAMGWLAPDIVARRFVRHWEEME